MRDFELLLQPGTGEGIKRQHPQDRALAAAAPQCSSVPRHLPFQIDHVPPAIRKHVLLGCPGRTAPLGAGVAGQEDQVGVEVSSDRRARLSGDVITSGMLLPEKTQGRAQASRVRPFCGSCCPRGSSTSRCRAIRPSTPRWPRSRHHWPEDLGPSLACDHASESRPATARGLTRCSWPTGSACSGTSFDYNQRPSHGSAASKRHWPFQQGPQRWRKQPARHRSSTPKQWKRHNLGT